MKIAFVILTLLLVLKAVFFYQHISIIKNSEKSVVHTYQVINAIENLYNIANRRMHQLHRFILKDLGLLKEFELKPMLYDPTEIMEAIKKIRFFIQDNPSQLRRLAQIEDLIKNYYETMKKNMALNDNERAKASIELLHIANGNFFIDEIYTKIDEMINEENRLLNIRRTADLQADQNFIYFISAIALITYIILFILAFMVFHYLSKAEMIEKKLRESEARFRRAIIATSDGLWDWDVVTNEVYYSPRLKEMLGYNEDDIDNTVEATVSLIHPHDSERVMAAVRDHMENRTTYNIEFQMRKKDGTYAWVQSRGQSIWDKKGQPLRMSGVLTDISQRKNIERMKNEFISTVSHELRTPLTSIRGSLGLLLANSIDKMSEKGHHLVEIAYKNCERLIFLINDILDLEKIESGQTRLDFQWVSLKTFVAQAVELNRQYSEKYQVHFILKEPIQDVSIYVDINRLMQVMTNLMSNAAKFSQPGGEVAISTHESGNYIRVCVTDHGCGVPDEFRSRIFGKFAQSDSSSSKQKSGAGLGLHISKAIITLFAGTIGFESEVNKGSTFFFDLPKVPPPEIDTTPKTEQMQQRLLVCEDDIDTAHLLHNILEKQHFQVDIAFSAEQAKMLLNANSYAGITIDLILPDENGIELIQEIRTQGKTQDIPIIVISARANEGKEELEGRAIGIIDWLPKPIDQVRLIEAVKKISRIGKKPVILYVEDDIDLVRIITYSLSDIADVVHAPTLLEAKRLFLKERVDLVILDITLPDGSGLKLLKILEGIATIPVIIFSASEVSREISEQVFTALVKSRTSEKEIVSTIKALILGDSNKR